MTIGHLEHAHPESINLLIPLLIGDIVDNGIEQIFSAVIDFCTEGLNITESAVFFEMTKQKLEISF